MTNDDKLRDYLKKVTVDLHDVRARLREVEQHSSEPLAIVGVSCRYPGGIGSPEQLWEVVRDGRDVISDCPTDRGWDLQRLYDPEPGRPGATYVREGGFLQDAAEFDASFFSISPREALAMDPQQRLLLEASWEAIESADIKPSSLWGSETGVFIGGASNGYGLGPSGSVAEDLAGHYVSGTLTSVMSGRVSYTFGFEGPAVTIDTACSSSLVALHLACGSLRAGESSLALVGGVCVMPTPIAFLELSRQRALAPDGRCKAFADGADGLGWGEGVGMLLLERASDARRLGHRILAFVRGSAVNQDGASNGLTAPNGPSQQRVIRDALANAGLSAHQVEVVEAHGTGTMLGDPIEAQALLGTYGQSRPQGSPLRLGSVKSNIGHTQAAAGMAGVIKMVMAMRHGLMPKTLHVDQPSQKVNWSAGSVSLLEEAEPWLAGSEPRRAGVSSFGISGTNSHVILEEAAPHVLSEEVAEGSDEQVSEGSESAPVDGGEHVPTGALRGEALPLVVSARDDGALRGQAARMSSFLRDNPDVEAKDVGFALLKRTAFDRRAVVIGENHQSLAGLLDGIANEAPGVDAVQGMVGPDGAGKVVFVFPGQGSQWAGMALELLQCSDVFARRLRECCEAFAPFIDWSVEDVLRDVEGAPDLERIEVVQPVLFAVMVALAELWKACGVHPDAVVGHSQGEIAAAHVAGGLSLQDAARIVALRSQMLTAMVGHGGVASIALGVEQVRERIERWGDRLSVAGVSGPRSTTVAGDSEALREFLEDCVKADVRAREVPATVATHSPHVEGLREQLIEALSKIEPRSSDIAFYSTVTGALFDTGGLNVDYWYRNLREPVELERVTRALLDEGYRTFIEVSPHPVLTMGMNETVEDVLSRPIAPEATGEEEGLDGRALDSAGLLGSLRRGDGSPRRFLASLGEAWVRGVNVDWEAVFPGSGAVGVELPTYAFQRQRYWLDAAVATGEVAAVGHAPVVHPLLSSAVALAESDGWLFTGRVSVEQQQWLVDHAIAGAVVVPGTTLVDVALSVGAEIGCELLEDLVHEATIVLSAERPAVDLQVSIGPPDELGRRTVAVFSRPEEAVWEGEDAWTRHARGMLAPVAQTLVEDATQVDGYASLANADAWPPEGAEPVPVEDVYDFFAGVGLEYGPAFLSIRAAWRRGEEVFTEVRLPEEERDRARRFNIHPALLDCSLQAMGVLMRTETPATPEYGRLPFAWTRVRLHASGNACVRVRMARSQAGGYSLVLADEQGRMVLVADSLVTRPFTAEALMRIRGVDRRSLLDVEWVLVTASEALPTAVLPEGWATLGASGSEGAADSHLDRAAPEAYPDLASLIDAIDGGASAPAVVLARFEGDDLADGKLPLASRQNLDRALSLVQEWLAEARLAGSRLVFMTKRAVSAGDPEGVSDLTVAPLWGMLRSVQSEHPGRFVLVDVDDPEAELHALASALIIDEPQLALRAGALLAPRLTHAAAERAEVVDVALAEKDVDEPDAAQAGERRFDPDADARHVAGIGLTPTGQFGSVLITGGTGLIGAALARHLVEEHGVQSVVLAGRRGLQAPGAENLLAELLELGAQAKIVACDVSDREQLIGLIDSIPSEYPLSAVVHSAGDLDDGMIDSMTSERIDRVLKPKLDAAWHLHQLTEGLDLSAFVLFSSSTGTIGSPGQSNYAAANAFLDALAAYRRGRGLPGISMAWGLWAEAAGMADELTATDRARIARAGDLALSTEEGLRLFDAAYVVDKPLMVPARLNMAALRAQARTGVVAPLLRGLLRVPAQAPTKGSRDSLVRRLASTSERERKRVVLDLVRAEVATVLGHPSPDAIDENRAFNELGFDSLTAVELRNRLAFASGIHLPATLAFDYPSSAALSGFLLEQISPEVGGQAGEGPSDADVRNALASIPLVRLREAGVMDTLMQLAGLQDSSGAAPDEDSVDEVDELDVASLVQMSLGNEDAVGETVEGSS